jgi:hypothetical protein
VSSITDNLSKHLSYARARGYPIEWLNGGVYYAVDLWYAVWSSDGTIKITVTTTASSSAGVVVAFGVNGANTSSPFDPNSSLPASGNSVMNVSINTSNANDFILGIWNGASSGTGVGSGFTAIEDVSICGTEYQIVSVKETGFDVSFSRSGYIVVGDAIRAAPPVTVQQNLLDIATYRLERKFHFPLRAFNPRPLFVSVSPARLALEVGDEFVFNAFVQLRGPSSRHFKYQWFENRVFRAHEVALASEQSLYTFTARRPGVFTVQARVSDFLGHTAESNLAVISVSKKLSVSRA